MPKYRGDRSLSWDEPQGPMEVGRGMESPLVPRGIGRDTAGGAENLSASMQVRGTKEAEPSLTQLVPLPT